MKYLYLAAALALAAPLGGCKQPPPVPATVVKKVHTPGHWTFIAMPKPKGGISYRPWRVPDRDELHLLGDDGVTYVLHVSAEEFLKYPLGAPCRVAGDRVQPPSPASPTP